jgi:hypothetical protein
MGERVKKVFINKACAPLKCALSDVFIAKQTWRNVLLLLRRWGESIREVFDYITYRYMYCTFISAKGTTLLSGYRVISTYDLYIYIGKRSLSSLSSPLCTFMYVCTLQYVYVEEAININTARAHTHARRAVVLNHVLFFIYACFFPFDFFFSPPFSPRARILSRSYRFRVVCTQCSTRTTDLYR